MKQRRKAMYCLYIPALALLAFFVIIPFFSTFYNSLCTWNGYSPPWSEGARRFVGLKNYIEIFSLSDKRFNRAFLNTVLYGFVLAVLQNVFGLMMALFVNSKFKGNRLVRTIVYMPGMIAGLVMGYTMTYLVSFDRGVFNEILGWFGVAPINWLNDGNRAKFLIIMVSIWQGIGGCMIIYLAGLQGVQKTYQEAALVDGATTIQVFFRITLPLLMPAITTNMITRMIGGLKMFDLVVSFTGGGPNYKTHSLMSYLNTQYFEREKAGYAAAIGMVSFLFIMIVSLILSKYFMKKQENIAE